MSKNPNSKGYEAEILKRLYDGEKLSSSDFYYSNSNQYFCSLKDKGIRLIEQWKPNKNGIGRHKERTLDRTADNIQRAKQLLIKWGYRL